MQSYETYKQNDNSFNIPASIKERTNQYLEMSCNIIQWFKNNYECTGDKNDICKMKDLYEDFILSIHYVNLTKNEKRKYNKAYFCDYFISNSFLSKYHKDVHKNIKNCIIGWKKIYDEDNTANDMY